MLKRGGDYLPAVRADGTAVIARLIHCGSVAYAVVAAGVVTRGARAHLGNSRAFGIAIWYAVVATGVVTRRATPVLHHRCLCIGCGDAKEKENC